MEKLQLQYFTKNDNSLRKKCEKIIHIDNDILSILDEMLEFMYLNKGIGLAANQINIHKRLVVIDLQENEIKSPLFLINPEIIAFSKEKLIEEEGCLSVPLQRADVERFKKIKVKYIDKNQNEQILEAEGLLAKCLQHEIDHLNGILFVDHLSKLKRDNILSKVKKILKENQ